MSGRCDTGAGSGIPGQLRIHHPGPRHRGGYRFRGQCVERRQPGHRSGRHHPRCHQRGAVCGLCGHRQRRQLHQAHLLHKDTGPQRKRAHRKRLGDPLRDPGDHRLSADQRSGGCGKPGHRNRLPAAKHGHRRQDRNHRGLQRPVVCGLYPLLHLCGVVRLRQQ